MRSSKFHEHMAELGYSYPKRIQGFLYPSETTKAVAKGEFDLTRCKLMIVPVDMFVYRPEKFHQTIAELPIDAFCGKPIPLRGVSMLNGVLDADDVTFKDIPGGCALGFIIYVENGLGTHRDDLILHISANQASAGGDVWIAWDDGPRRICDFGLASASGSDEGGAPS